MYCIVFERKFYILKIKTLIEILAQNGFYVKGT